MLRRMGAQLARRGPDDEVVHVDDSVAMIFRRLSINDVEGGAQPFVIDGGRVVAATNGEIYNHRELRAAMPSVAFRSACDTEVIGPLAQRQGPDFPRAVRGMFASAVWLRDAASLLLSRDRFGIKPLYFTRRGDYVAFASELKALLALPDGPKTFDWRHVHVQRRALPPGIEEVAPGTTVTLGANRSVHHHRYWDVRKSLASAEANTSSAERTIERYAELFSASVEEHLLSDVPLGVFLSGGIDSSLVTAEVARKHSGPLHAFSILHESTLECGDAHNAEEVARESGCHLHFLDCRGGDIASRIGADLSTFEYYVWLADKPWFSTEYVLKHELHRLAKATVPGLKVVLLGQGADEFAGGYSHQSGLGVKNRSWEEYLASTPGARRRGVGRFLRDDFDEVFLDVPWGEWGRQVILHAEHTLRDQNLHTEDRVSSAQGIEARVPFLDHRLVELTASVPMRAHATLFWDKRIVREVLARRLPSYPAATHRKYPFIYTGNLSVAGDNLWSVLCAVFSEFRESYLCDPRSPLEGRAVVDHFERLKAAPTRPYEEIEALQEAMSLAVWNRWVGRLRQGEAVTFREPPPIEEFRGELPLLRRQSSAAE